ncbi:hypothetical protein C1646_753751 [Rhizophagus diaphanus]|nr:hypothetical protein C1646_753751 [Rhizophagus diaphanus] [Rhizophagus sp. MUCL 43196]
MQDNINEHHIQYLDIDSNLFCGKKVDVHEELKNDLKDQLPDKLVESDEECIKEGKKRTIGEGKAVDSVRGRGARGRVTLALGTTPHPDNTNPKATSVPVGAPLNVRPHRGPYIGYWPSRVNYNAVRWYHRAKRYKYK